MTARERLLSRVHPEPNTGCWLFGGGWNSKGYGVLTVDGRQEYAHRVSYREHSGRIGDQYVLHTCDVRCCVNPDHLYLGDAQDNADDAVRRGRSPTGRGNGRAILKRSEVLDVYRSPESQQRLADRYGVSRSTVRDIKIGKNWSWLTQPDRRSP